MKAAVSEWIRTVAGTSLLCCCAMYLCPKGRVRDALRVVCGVVLALALISPVEEFDFRSYSESLAVYRAQAEDINAMADEAYSSLTRSVIEQEYAAYISDKAAEQGLALSSVTVGVEWGGDGVWYPLEAYISGTEQAKAALMPVIERELGIPEERQYWNNDEA